MGNCRSKPNVAQCTPLEPAKEETPTFLSCNTVPTDSDDVELVSTSTDEVVPVKTSTSEKETTASIFAETVPEFTEEIEMIASSTEDVKLVSTTSVMENAAASISAETVEPKGDVEMIASPTDDVKLVNTRSVLKENLAASISVETVEPKGDVDMVNTTSEKENAAETVESEEDFVMAPTQTKNLLKRKTTKKNSEANTVKKKIDIILRATEPGANFSVMPFLALSDLGYKEENAYEDATLTNNNGKFASNLSPTIECKGKQVSGCVAVLKFLCRTYPLKYGKYYPEGDIEKVTSIDWLCDYINEQVLSQLPKAIYPTLGLALRPGDVSSMETTKPYTKKSQEAASEYILNILQKKIVEIFLKNTTFLLSNEPTIADYRFAPMLNYIKVGCVLPARLQKYYSDMSKLPGFEKACQPVANFTSSRWKHK